MSLLPPYSISPTWFCSFRCNGLLIIHFPCNTLDLVPIVSSSSVALFYYLSLLSLPLGFSRCLSISCPQSILTEALNARSDDRVIIISDVFLDDPRVSLHMCMTLICLYYTMTETKNTID